MKLFKKNNKDVIHKFWIQIEPLFYSFYSKNIKFKNHYTSNKNQIFYFFSISQYYDVIYNITDIIYLFALDVISVYDITIFKKLYKFICKWNKIVKQEQNNIVGFDFTMTDLIKTRFIFIEVFNILCENIYDEIKFIPIRHFFNDLHLKEDINIRELFSLSIYFKNIDIIKLIINNYDIKHICKFYFSLDVENNIKPKKLFEILTFTNIYNI